MRDVKRWVGLASRASCVLAFSVALDACDLGYRGLEPIVSLGNLEGTCESPGQVSVSDVEVSAASAYLAPDASVWFSPLSDGDALPVTTGLQGANMVVVALRVTGVDRDLCLAQQTTLVDADGTLEARLARPVRFTLIAPGVAQSASLFLPGEFVAGPSHTLTVTIGGKTLTRRIAITR